VLLKPLTRVFVRVANVHTVVLKLEDVDRAVWDTGALKTAPFIPVLEAQGHATVTARNKYRIAATHPFTEEFRRRQG
jgi:hypothetical protein